MTRRAEHGRWRTSLASAIVTFLALLATACHPVQPPGVAPWDPTGILESVVGGSGHVRVTGWATQWDVFVNGAQRDQGPVGIALLVDGEWANGIFPADRARQDVDRVLVSKLLWPLRQPVMGYGFDVTVPAPKGEVGVCVAALNQNLDVMHEGDHALLGCRTVTVR